jgi:hypothetical protein
VIVAALARRHEQSGGAIPDADPPLADAPAYPLMQRGSRRDVRHAARITPCFPNGVKCPERTCDRRVERLSALDALARDAFFDLLQPWNSRPILLMSTRSGARARERLEMKRIRLQAAVERRVRVVPPPTWRRVVCGLVEMRRQLKNCPTARCGGWRLRTPQIFCFARGSIEAFLSCNPDRLARVGARARTADSARVGSPNQGWDDLRRRLRSRSSMLSVLSSRCLTNLIFIEVALTRARRFARAVLCCSI